MTAPLLSRFRELKERAEARSQDARAQEEFARYERSKADFEQSQDSLNQVDELARAATNAGVVTLPLEEDREWARQIAKQLRRNLTSATGHEVEDLANKANAAVAHVVTRTESRFDSELERWAERQPSPSDHVLDVLEPIAGPATERTRQAVATFHRLSASRPRTASAINQLAAAAVELREAYQAVASAAPEGVRDFLERAPLGVPLDEIDRDVLAWLRDNGASSSFELRLRR